MSELRGSLQLAMSVLAVSAPLLTGVIGCGGGDNPKPKAEVHETRQAAPAPPGNPPPVARVEKPREKGPSGPTLNYGESFFEVAKEPEPVIRPEQRYTEDPAVTGGNVDRYEMALLGPGLNSTNFVVTDLPPSSGAGTSASVSLAGFPAGYTPLSDGAEEAGPDGLPRRIRCAKDGSIMVLVPGGLFTQGHDSGPADVQPAHQVQVEHFYIDSCEITFEQYEQFRDTLRREKKATPRAPEGRPRSPRDPVTGLAWGDAAAYARWAVKELPTEAQWEKAARGTQGFEHPWGNGIYLWHRTRKPGQIDAVASFPTDKSPCGAFDMAGNAREWCADWYSSSSYQDAVRKAGAGKPVQNPTGSQYPDGEKSRVVRGGDPQWRVWTRGHASNLDRPLDVGFRCVLTFRPNPKPGGKSGGR